MYEMPYKNLIMKLSNWTYCIVFIKRNALIVVDSLVIVITLSSVRLSKILGKMMNTATKLARTS